MAKKAYEPMRAPGEAWPVKAWEVRVNDRILGMPGWIVQGYAYTGEGDIGGVLDRQHYVLVCRTPTGETQTIPADGHTRFFVLDPRPDEAFGGQRARMHQYEGRWCPVMPCPECNGNGGPWPEFPSICGGVPCPTCDGVCQTCEGSPDPTTWNWRDL